MAISSAVWRSISTEELTAFVFILSFQPKHGVMFRGNASISAWLAICFWFFFYYFPLTRFHMSYNCAVFEEVTQHPLIISSLTCTKRPGLPQKTLKRKDSTTPEVTGFQEEWRDNFMSYKTKQKKLDHEVSQVSIATNPVKQCYCYSWCYIM